MTRVDIVSQVRSELAALYQARQVRDESRRYDEAARRIVPVWRQR